ncbi:putative ribonuclease H-like domain-containing protein [Tanacetum coccineum]|uniref:Ribonuclease H-like domain-containing protein n=1 Tax=Tanacetum coccineum TaxID=301880 RepID=A0ABQ5E2M7_9ASTR
MEPKKVIQALEDPSWIEAMQEELLQFQLQKVWTLVNLPNGKRAIGTKWVFRNKKDERGIVVRNKARLVAQEQESTSESELEELPEDVCAINVKFVICSSLAWSSTFSCKVTIFMTIVALYFSPVKSNSLTIYIQLSACPMDESPSSNYEHGHFPL